MGGEEGRRGHTGKASLTSASAEPETPAETLNLSYVVAVIARLPMGAPQATAPSERMVAMVEKRMMFCFMM